MNAMFHCEQDLLANLVVLTPKLARRKFRQHIFEAWGWKCAYCDKQLDENTATIDHIIPKHKGGQNVRQNMACSCNTCNRLKASTPLSEFYTPQNLTYSEERLVKLKQWMEQKSCSINLSSSGSATPYISHDFCVGWIAS
jgi:hypothetical protein